LAQATSVTQFDAGETAFAALTLHKRWAACLYTDAIWGYDLSRCTWI